MGELWKWISEYQNTTEFHQKIVDEFVSGTNSIPRIKEHRDFIEESQNRFNLIYGHGHRSIQYLWKLIVDEMPQEFSFLEIGVYKGQILSLIEMLSEMSNRKSKIVGVTPLFDPAFANYDRLPFIQNIYNQFKLNVNNTMIYNGFSQDVKTSSEIYPESPFEIVYIDGDHSYEITTSDIKTYSKMIKKNGFLVIDDCCDFKNMPPGMFKGIIEVSNAARDTVEKNSDFKELLTCMHVRVWQRIKDDSDIVDKEFWNNI